MTAAVLILECIDDHLVDLEKAPSRKIAQHLSPLAAEVVRLGGRIVERPWVADVTDGERRFIRPIKDYSGAEDGIGARGVRARFFLKPGRIYEVNAPTGGASSRRFRVTVRNGEVVEL